MGTHHRKTSASGLGAGPGMVNSSASARLASVSGKRSNRRSSQPLRMRVRLPRPAVLGRHVVAGLRRGMPALIASGIAVAVIGALFMGHRFITTSPRFALTHVEFRGNSHRSAAELRAELPVADGANLFTTHLGKLASAMRADPWLASVDVSRELPHTLIVTVREREPVAVVELGGLYLADASGTPFKRLAVDANEGAALPIVTGVGRAEYLADPAAAATTVHAALAALTAWTSVADGRPARPSIGEVHIDARRGLVLHARDGGLAIRLGDRVLAAETLAAASADMQARLDQFDRTWAALSASERNRAEVLHLDNDTRPDHVTIALAAATR